MLHCINAQATKLSERYITKLADLELAVAHDKVAKEDFSVVRPGRVRSIVGRTPYGGTTRNFWNLSMPTDVNDESMICSSDYEASLYT